MDAKFSVVVTEETAVPVPGRDMQCVLALPQVTGSGPAARRIGRFYAAVRRSFLARLRRTGATAETGADCALLCTVTENSAACLSIVREYRTGAGRLRAADLWDPQTGWPLTAADFFPSGGNVRRRIARLIAADAARRSRAEPALRTLTARKIRRHLAPDGFYLRGSTLVAFFNPGVLAPARYGPLEFPLEQNARFPAAHSGAK